MRWDLSEIGGRAGTKKSKGLVVSACLYSAHCSNHPLQGEWVLLKGPWLSSQ